MNFKNNKLAIGAVVVGICLLTTSALADVIMGSGYLSLKNSAKSTSHILTKDAQSFSVDLNFSLSQDGQVLVSEGCTTKVDKVNQRVEENNKALKCAEDDRFYYHDVNMNVYKNGKDEVMHVNMYKEPQDLQGYTEDPFEQEQVKDLEKVADAFVGSLQDIVQVEEKNGMKMYTCNVDSSQIPMYVNALGSCMIKYSLFHDHSRNELGLADITNDIFISNASAKITANADDVITDGVMTGKFKGNDKSGVEHEYVIEITLCVTGIDSTVVEVPDITGAQIEYNTDRSGRMGVMQSDIGTYSRPVTKINEDGKLEKIGEKVLEITSVDTNSITGRYYENGSDEESLNIEFTAEYKEDSDIYGMVFTYSDGGEEKIGIIRKNDELEFSIDFDVTIGVNGWNSNGECISFTRQF